MISIPKHLRDYDYDVTMIQSVSVSLVTLMLLKVLQKACKPVICCQVIAPTLAVRMVYLSDAAAKVYEHFARDITFLNQFGYQNYCRLTVGLGTTNTVTWKHIEYILRLPKSFVFIQGLRF
jgi:hypothetical protein